jgi:hypothetical protein
MFKAFLVSITAFMLLMLDSVIYTQTGMPEDPRSFLFAIQNTDRTALRLHHMDSQFGASSDSVQIGWVRQYVSGYVPAFDFAYAIAVDSQIQCFWNATMGSPLQRSG